MDVIKTNRLYEDIGFIEQRGFDDPETILSALSEGVCLVDAPHANGYRVIRPAEEDDEW